MNESIKQLLNLQSHDLELDRLQSEAAAIPAQVETLKSTIKQNQVALENSKKEATQLQLAKKQKDLDLEMQENAIRKHSTELNAVKSNDAYKALMGEIDKAKRDKSALEDQVLMLMDQIDQANKSWKEREASSKGIESDLQRRIGELETKKIDLESQMTAKQSDRVGLAGALPTALAPQYERLRGRHRHSATVVPIRNEQCMGCHMKVSQNLVNELRRGQKMLTCEHCSRIVYLEEAPAEATPPTAK
jgi:uncharacterized protein